MVGLLIMCGIGFIGLAFGISYEIRQSELRLMDYIDKKLK